jgi:hypothetical protein
MRQPRQTAKNIMENLNFKTSQKGYILERGEIQSTTYLGYLAEYGADETTTGRGVAPRLYVEGNTVMTWGVKGNNHKMYASCKNKTEAKFLLYSIWQNNVSDNWDAPRFFTTKKDLFEDVADSESRTIEVVKRYFKIQGSQNKAFLISQEEEKQCKLGYDKRPSFSKNDMLNFIKDNKKEISVLLRELDVLKLENKQSEWQVKANSLVQRVSNNDFRVLKWKEIYNLTREN